ncbi:MAG: hypothetical protein ED556_13585 [Winogradskyella sp.]|uniref:hypothetical protein n=1 Tax=Winogradskyella sp. TaxID=1883156 RepID=UPI000F3AF26D|nr:hypothetical protein [Winogradskyella sp.]RNC83579.1 MAG: hypothetical protein ED556_13585 [Winogradskyella sp.]
MKKVYGYLCIAIGALLMMAFIYYLSPALISVSKITTIFNSGLSASERLMIFGGCIYWIIHIMTIIISFKLGFKIMRHYSNQ